MQAHEKKKGDGKTGKKKIDYLGAGSCRKNPEGERRVEGEKVVGSNLGRGPAVTGVIRERKSGKLKRNLFGRGDVIHHRGGSLISWKDWVRSYL